MIKAQSANTDRANAEGESDVTIKSLRSEVERLTGERDEAGREASTAWAENRRLADVAVAARLDAARNADRADAAEASLQQMTKALERIERWFGEFPPSGSTWEDGRPMSYGAAFGSNGERDYMRAVARAALAIKGESR